MRSCALVGRLFLLLCFAELAKTAELRVAELRNSELGEAAAEQMNEIYRFGEMATTKCQAGDVKITDDKECKAATSALFGAGKYNNPASRSDKPGGCWAGTSGYGNFNSNMAGQAATGRRPICKRNCKTNTQPALTACPAGFYTSDTTTSCTECVNNQAQIRECGCEDTSSSCDGVYMKFYFSAEEKNNCTSDSSSYLSVSNAAYSKYLTFRENQMAGFWKRGHVKPDGKKELGGGASVDQAKSPAKVSWVTPQGHVSIDLLTDPQFGPQRLYPYLMKHFNDLVVTKYPTEEDKKAKRNGVSIADFGTEIIFGYPANGNGWRTYFKQNFFDLDWGGQVDFGADAPYRLETHIEICNVNFIGAAKLTHRKDERSSDVIVQAFAKVVPHKTSHYSTEKSECDITMAKLDTAFRMALADLRNDVADAHVGDHCSISAPSNGAMGTCKSTLASGSKCKPKCSHGYKVSGQTACTKGSLSAATCVPKDKCIVESPTDSEGSVWGNLGTCSSIISDGTTCQPECSAGYSASGPTKCSKGKLIQETKCIENSCKLTAPANGSLRGNGYQPCELSDGSKKSSKSYLINGELVDGKKCWITCNNGKRCVEKDRYVCMKGKLLSPKASCKC